MRKLLLLALVLFAQAAGAQTAIAETKLNAPPAKPIQDQIIGTARAPLPPREAEYIGIVQDARHQYLTARSIDARRNARMAMQSATHNFMGLSHNAMDWVGVFKDTKKNPLGTQSVEIEISPNVTIETWDNPASDATYFTLFQQTSPMGKLVSTLSIGEEVRFTADLIGAVISTDEEMVLHPRIIGKFSKLERIEQPAK